MNLRDVDMPVHVRKLYGETVFAWECSPNSLWSSGHSNLEEAIKMALNQGICRSYHVVVVISCSFRCLEKPLVIREYTYPLNPRGTVTTARLCILERA